MLQVFKKSSGACLSFLSFLIICLLPGIASAQVNLSNGSPTYTQNFDGLGSSTVTWSDNSTLVGWYAHSSNLSNIVAGTGSSNTGAIYNFGNTGDRALGSLASGSTNTLNFGVKLVNTGTSNITSLAISYTGEQWRCGGNTTPHTNTFSYAVNPSSVISGSYTGFSMLDFTGPIANASASALDGNAGANRTAKSGTITGLNVAPGGAIWLRFSDVNDGGNDHGLSIDDLTVTATFAAASVSDYYSGPTGDLDNVNSWWSDAGGTTGTHPANFTDAGKTFHISNGTAGNIAGSNWTVSGSGSKVIVDGTDLTIQATASITATIDVNAGRKLTIKHTTLPALGTLNATSTVVYSNITFTSTFVVPSAATYGNIIFDNSIVVNTPTTQTLIFAGDFILQNSSSFTGSDVSANGYNLTTTGTANQTINANGLPFQIRGLNNNNTVAKTGMLTLAPNTDISIWNSIIMNCSGTANMFSDGGNTLTLYNNISLGGNAAGYNLTGTIIPSLASGTAKFRGFVGSAASDAAPVAAALNNVIINTSGSGGSAFLPTSGATITIKGNLTITSSGSGNLVLNANTIQIGGNLTHTPSTNSITATGSTVEFNGTGAQNYSTNVAGGNTLVNMTMSNSGAGLTLGAPLNISGVLTLTNGKITTGANVLSLTATGTTSGGNSNAYVNGNLLKTMPSGGTTTMAYEVGDATYAPILLTFGSSVSSGSVTVAAKAGPHPQISSSHINTGNFVNRYWSITNAGVAAPSVDIALSYSSGDMTGMPNTGYVTRMYDGMVWATTPGTTNTTSASAPLLANASTGTGIAGGSFSGDYIAGQLYCPTAITGTLNVCETSTVTVGNSISGGVWSSSNSNVTIGSASGVVAGVSAGTSIITYMLNTGCQTTATATVNPLPAGITGAAELCVGASTTLGSPGGGAWSTSNGNVSIGSATGVTTGVSAGISTITYTLPTGCLTTRGVTINSLPSPISGPTDVCEGLAVTLSNSGGGVWSSSNGNVNIGSATGFLTGVTAGISTVTYTLPTGCITTTAVTVHPLPSPIAGAADVCIGLSTTLTGTGGGTWSSSNGNVSIGAASGMATGVSAGTSEITYTLPTGCITTIVMTVDPLPAAISGIMVVCEGATTTLSNTGGGTWTSSNSNATIGSATGIVTGVSAGVSTISYMLPTGCITTADVTINSLPSAITGVAAVCSGQTTILTGSGGGSWTSSNSNAVIGFGTGIVTGVTAGTSVITYMLPTGCITTSIVTVNPLPLPISGIPVVCEGATVTLSNTGGGTWSSSNSNATAGSTTGIVTGVAAGTSIITFMLPTGCITAVDVTINPLPAAITGMAAACEGATTTLTGTGGGVWSSSNANADIGTSTGVVTGVTAGTSTISFTLPTGCFTTTVFTVNQLPSAITGAVLFCQGTTTALTDAISGGSWSSSNLAVATVGAATGMVFGMAGGNADITYTLPTGCLTITTVTVNTAPDASNFTSPAATDICEGGVSAITINSTSLGTATFTATYDLSGANIATGNTASVSMGASSGAFSTTALSATGSTTMTVTSITNSFGCVTNLSGGNTVTFTVNPLPAAISGLAFVCAGSTTTLASPGAGVWSSDNVSVATVGSGTGIVSGIMAGAASISYVLPTGCSVARMFTVNALPATITGANTVCVGASVSLNNTTSGGTWSSSNPSEATVSSSGIVSGVAASMPTITYTLPTGCKAIKGITVNPLPVAPASITGPGSVCAGGSVITLSSSTPGGMWSSALSLIASVGTTGIVTGVNAGMTVISYTVSNSCGNAASIFLLTVNPLPAVPAAINGPSSVCTGSVISLSSATPGGAWSSSTPAVATISLSGVVSGIAPGVDTIRYAITNSCGSASVNKLILVNPLPVVSAISGPSHVCTGTPIILSATPSGGSWSSSGSHASVTGGYVMGVIAGVDTIKYSISNSCGTVTSSKVVSVTATPNAGTITGSSKVCVGSSTLLFNPVAGGTWTVTNPAASVSSGLVTGLVAGIDTIRYTMPGACGTYSAVTKVITVNALPNNYSLTGGGAYCSGGVGVHIGLNGSQPTDCYQLYKGTTTTGSSITGTGSAIDFGLKTDTGTYTVVAGNPITGCSRVMTGSPQIGFNAVILPEVTIYTSSVPDILVGEILTFTAIVTNGMTAYSYTWQVGSTYLGDTTHTYVTNRHMLFDNDVITCTIKSYGICGEVYGSKSVTVNLHNVGVNEPGRNEDDLSIYPSPSNGSFIVKGTMGNASTEEVSMEIADVSGRVVHTASFIANNGVVNEHVHMSDAVSNGTYILYLHRGSERKALRLVVER